MKTGTGWSSMAAPGGKSSDQAAVWKHGAADGGAALALQMAAAAKEAGCREEEGSGAQPWRVGVHWMRTRKPRGRSQDQRIPFRKQGAAEAVHFVDHNAVHLPRPHRRPQPLQGRALQTCPTETAVIEMLGHQRPALTPLAGDVGLRRLPLRIQATKILLPPRSSAFSANMRNN